MKELKVGTNNVAFSPDNALIGVICVQKDHKDYIQIISASNFSLLSQFEVKSKNTEQVVFSKQGHSVFVAEKYFQNSIFLYLLSGLLLGEVKMSGTFSCLQLWDDKLYVFDEELNLKLLDDLCLNVYLSKNLSEIIDEIEIIHGFEEITNLHNLNSLNEKKRSPLNSFSKCNFSAKNESNFKKKK